MAKTRYYLFARDCESNHLSVISFPDENNYSNWIHSLEDIDLYTSQFSTREEFILFLKNNGQISTYDVDFFIASRNANNIQYLEPIFGKSSRLSEIAHQKKNGAMNLESVSSILDDFSRRMMQDSSFYYFVVYGFSDIFQKYIDYYKQNRGSVSCFSNKYRDGKWAFQSYPLLRNIIESYIRYENMGNDFFAMSNQIINKKKERDTYHDMVNMMTDKEYINGQLSFFEPNVKIDKLSYILEHLSSLTLDLFSSSSQVELNNYFKNQTFMEELRSLLDPNILTLLYQYVRDQHDLSYSLDYDFFSLSDSLKKDKKMLVDLLMSNSKLLDKTYSFFLLYNKCRKDQGGEYGDGSSGKERIK